MRKVDPCQLSLAFADSPKGGDSAATTGRPSRREQLLLIARTKTANRSPACKADSSRLLEEVASPPNLAEALLTVARNKGAPGPDGQSVEEAEAMAPQLLERLCRDLLAGDYRPGPIRRVMIPKPGGGERGLGIPNVVDRIVQQAVLQILEPVFDPDFHRSSHGFRVGRGAQTAIAEAKEHLAAGYEYVVDIDLSRFFDRVHHQRLLARMSQKVDDRRVLNLVWRMLTAKVVLPDGTIVTVAEGTPQGGPLSPLLSNIVLDEFDRELERRGHRFVRYADDCNIFVRSKRAADRVIASIRGFLERRMRLLVNEEKSAVRRPSEVHFLGFRFEITASGISVRLSEKARKAINLRIRDLTPTNYGGSVKRCIEEVNRYFQGWIAYFRLCTADGIRDLERLDAHTRRRIRCIIVRHSKRPRHLFRHLLNRGVSDKAAIGTAFCSRGPWNKSNRPGMTRAYPNKWFHERMVSLASRWRELNPSPLRQASEQLCLPL